MLFGLDVGVLVYAALLCGMFGFLARDELNLRLLMLAGSGFYLVYYSLVTGGPLWDAIYTNTALAVVNLSMICIVIAERSTLLMNSEQIAFYRSFPLMTPGQFRKLMRVARPITSPVLTRQGEPLDTLYYLREGTAQALKDGHAFSIDQNSFIGEVAFVTGAPASATVEVPPEATVIGWHKSELDRIFLRTPALKVALMAHLNADMARKVAASRPEAAR